MDYFSPTMLTILSIVGVLGFLLQIVGVIRAVQRKEWVWTVVLLLVNTFGILPLYYLLVVAKTSKNASIYSASENPTYKEENPMNKTV
ncbi:MAG: hypothetical protein GW775_02240 [Candidatus Magasanikbacteria bacterium]|uniref:DUF5652 domain-containing protein n=1 Tax=Candidatus Magasanikbacteria bacterium CG10_big_fil_rev_8_21_14_0_10_38_6 TaxID=1974647 RepID=A0A2M6P2E7_9BACT|nr:hypothetical protein [Candidatus Magasanikbacteria bacterium]PIR77886.1 MAG: hypothetical protein COU30_00035 [Candidatus Magasanikbacteria bacterium CG10_big_fil_rev_8_21_14_0_10_38_6]